MCRPYPGPDQAEVHIQDASAMELDEADDLRVGGGIQQELGEGMGACLQGSLDRR